MGERQILHLSEMESNDTAGMQRDIKRWIDAKPGRTFDQFAQLCYDIGKVSKGSIENIYYWKGVGEEPNWTRRVRDVVMEVIDCEPYHFKKHNIE